MLPLTNVIAIDDSEEDLASIGKALQQLGIACLLLHYSSGAATHFPVGLRGVRLILLDINLIGGTVPSTSEFGSNPVMFAPILSILNQTLSMDNGPYILMTWSVQSHLHNSLIEFLHVKGKGNIPLPIVSTYLDKSKYLSDGKLEEQGASHLKEDILNRLNEFPKGVALLDWEHRVKNAASDTLAALLDLIPANERLRSLEQEMEQLLTALAQSAVGLKNVERDRLAAVNEALLPILLDRVSQVRIYDSLSKTTWEKAISTPSNKASIDNDRCSKLNTFFHIAFDEPGTDAATRGAVVAPDWLDNREQFNHYFRHTPEELAKQFLGGTVFAGEGKPNEALEFLKRCRWVLLETRPVCDYAQQQPGLLRFILGLETPDARPTGVTSH